MLEPYYNDIRVNLSILFFAAVSKTNGHFIVCKEFTVLTKLFNLCDSATWFSLEYDPVWKIAFEVFPFGNSP